MLCEERNFPIEALRTLGPQYLLAGRRNLEVNTYNLEELSAALQRQQAIVVEFFTALQQTDTENGQILEVVTHQELQLRQSQEQVKRLPDNPRFEQIQHAEVEAHMNRHQAR